MSKDLTKLILAQPRLKKLSERPKIPKPRLFDLSAPKVRLDNEDELVGPGSYDPSESFLSTKAKSPSVSICRSDRFLTKKLKDLKFQIKRLEESPDLSSLNYHISDLAKPPKYSFKRTGHNLILVQNPGFPGVGRYTSRAVPTSQSYSFTKAKKNFNWKKGKKYSVRLGQLF